MADEKKAEREYTTLSVSPPLATRIRIITAHRNITQVEALDKYAGPAIEREYRKVVAEMNRAADPDPAFANELGENGAG